ncbi:MAG: hypothetical protein KatS3mg024_1795 [Armatimonadota bacterium]|nr:MAG: hypothetical protein KatS3mg024_1795 [Armatimonadota bacterium]
MATSRLTAETAAAAKNGRAVEIFASCAPVPGPSTKPRARAAPIYPIPRDRRSGAVTSATSAGGMANVPAAKIPWATRAA